MWACVSKRYLSLILCISSSHICLEKRWFPQETLYTVNLHELLLYNRLSPFFSFFSHTHSPSAIEPTKPPEAGTRNTLAQRTLTADTRSFPAYLPDTQWKDLSQHTINGGGAPTAVYIRAALSVAAT